MTGRPGATEPVRHRIIDVTRELLANGGRSAVSTRAICAAADVTPPTIYRLFGDKQGLLDAVVSHNLTVYLAGRGDPTGGEDAVDDLRAGWDLHISFALAQPATYSLMYADRTPGAVSPAATHAWDALAALIHRIAETGHLSVAEDAATKLVHAAGTGTALTLISMPPDGDDPTLSSLAREAVIAAITHHEPTPDQPTPATAAITLQAVMAQSDALTPPERELLDEWLTRIIDDPSAA